jgi:hypothetical protein
VLERPKPPKVDGSTLDRFGTGESGVHRKVGQKYQDWLDANPFQTVGWKPTCACDAGDPVPCTVLDPFAGAATTGVAALQYGQHFLGIELNPKYIEIAEQRLQDEQKRLLSVHSTAYLPFIC